MKKPAVWAEEDVASLAAALMVQRPPARARKDALLQAERLSVGLSSCWSSSANAVNDIWQRERAAQLEEEANRETCRREALERRVEILEEENRNLCRRTR